MAARLSGGLCPVNLMSPGGQRPKLDVHVGALRHAGVIDDLLHGGAAQANHAVADGVVPRLARDLPRVEVGGLEGGDVLGAVPEEVHLLRGDGNALLAVPRDNATHRLARRAK